ncbi:hypothetical protein ZIOFF_028682 [Zingiber officinale]|uniref:Uncharacterized protein n=1 Tax=Zingiber officinale TaxID=94328 RepID=A0A8J5GWC5_ZINOF|nr:hypothetical protein ZIOFF_028682 [Zingiber officinale]
MPLFHLSPNAHSSSTFFSSRCRRAQFLSLCVVGFALAFLLAFLLAVAFLLAAAAALSFSPSRRGFCPNAPSSVVIEWHHQVTVPSTKRNMKLYVAGIAD